MLRLRASTVVMQLAFRRLYVYGLHAVDTRLFRCPVAYARLSSQAVALPPLRYFILCRYF